MTIRRVSRPNPHNWPPTVGAEVLLLKHISDDRNTEYAFIASSMEEADRAIDQYGDSISLLMENSVEDQLLGPTGQYPEGKSESTDEGELRFAVGRTAGNEVKLDFGTPVAWFSLPPEKAIELATLITKHALACR